MTSSKQLYGEFFTKMNLSFDDYFLKIEDFQSQNSIYKSKKLEVLKILEKKTGQLLAAKVYNVDMNKFSKVEKINLPRSIYFMSKLNHPSIIKLVGFSPINFKKQLKPVVITEIAQNGSLFDLLKNERKSKKRNSKWTPTKKLITIYGIASSMKYLHSQSILHRNLSPSNILFDDSFYPKLSNFDFLKETTEKLQKEDLEVFGEPEYVAPEVWMRKGYSRASDVYAFSFIVYQILTNEKIYKTKSVSKIMSEVVNKKKRPSFKFPIPQCYKDLIQSCWSDDPLKRPSFLDIVEKMKTDSNFILKDVNIDEFIQYVKLIDDSQCEESQSDKIKVEENESSDDESYETMSDNGETKVKEIDSNDGINGPLSEVNFFEDISKYEKLKEIGKGSSGVVFSIKEKETGRLFAAKVLRKEIDEFTKSELKTLYREFNIMTKINHPAVLKTIGISLVNFVNIPKPTIIFDLMNGSLYDLLRLERKGLAPKEWNKEKKLIMILGIAFGMSYLHKNNILHKDLKPGNILIDEFWHPKICDYMKIKRSHSLYMDQTTDAMTPMYMAPEVLENDNFVKESDVYSFSLICYEIITGKAPYEYKSPFQLFKSIMQGVRPKFDSSTPFVLQDLISRCWSQEYQSRPSFDEIIDFLKNCDIYEFLGDDGDDEYFQYINYIENYSAADNSEQLFTKVNIDFVSEIEEEESSKHISTELDNNQTIDLNNFEKKEKIGKGAFAKVYKVIDKKTSKIYAAKVLNNELCDLSQKEQFNFSRELKILSKLHYESIMKFIGYISRNFKGLSKSVFILELALNGSLEDILELERKGCSVPNWDETKKFISIFGIASGMKYMHSIPILHRDLKPENILLDDDLYPKISDFGLSKEIKIDNHLTEYPLGTPRYIAPEIWRDNEYTEAVDVYAFAMIVYEIVTGERPLMEFKLKEQIWYNVLMKQYHPSFKYPIPDCYRNLIEKCWSFDPHKRPTFSQIVSMLKEDPEFVDNVDLDEFIIYTEQIGESYLVNEEKSNQEQQLKPKQVNSKEIKMTTNQNKISEIVKEETNKTIQKIIESETSKNPIHDLSKYEQKEIISKEEFTKTVKVIDKETGNSFAARISNIDMSLFSKEEMNQIYNEMSEITQLNHPSILKIIGFSPFSFKKEPKPVIVTEITSSRTLQSIFEMNNNSILLTDWNSTKKLICIYGLASAMKYLHSNEIMHRQLMPKNILIDQFFHPKLRNFGFCTHLINLTSMNTMSSSKIQDAYVYSAPEILSFEEFTKASDVYSFSIIVYEIITGKKPFNELSDYSRIYNEVVIKGNRPNISSKIQNCYKIMIEDCWAQNPRDRPSFDEIVDTLENDQDFISSDINENEYHEYIKMILSLKEANN